MSCYAEHSGAKKDARELRRLAKLTEREHIGKWLLNRAEECDEQAAESWRDCQQEARADAYYDEHGLNDDFEEDEDDE